MKKILLAAVVAAAACSKKAPPPPPEKTALQSAVQSASAAETCARVIPMHWSPSLPVPALDDGRLVYKMFFYGRDGDPQAGFTFHHAEGDATLDAGGKVLACATRAGGGGSLPKFQPKPGVTLDDIERRELELYPQLQEAAQLFAQGRELTADEKKRVAATAEAFEFFVEDGRGPDYRAASPAFWAWVEKNGGKAPAAK